MIAIVVRASKALGLIFAFSLVGFGLIKLVFTFVCWGIGHDGFEAMIGMIASIGFGAWIGIEAYLSLKDWRSHRAPQHFDASR
ncbi:hypothetical protein FG152_18040 [Ochrobactrum sp. XJ1]|nr:hypothetical protein [Ochrobactrum sp. XJ1]